MGAMVQSTLIPAGPFTTALHDARGFFRIQTWTFQPLHFIDICNAIAEENHSRFNNEQNTALNSNQELRGLSF